jgi:hypothetical protein
MRCSASTEVWFLEKLLLIVSPLISHSELARGASFIYSPPAEKSHGARREGGACFTIPLSSVKPDELVVLDGLNRGPRTGVFSGG